MLMYNITHKEHKRIVETYGDINTFNSLGEVLCVRLIGRTDGISIVSDGNNYTGAIDRMYRELKKRMYNAVELLNDT